MRRSGHTKGVMRGHGDELASVQQPHEAGAAARAATASSAWASSPPAPVQKSGEARSMGPAGRRGACSPPGRAGCCPCVPRQALAHELASTLRKSLAALGQRAEAVPSLLELCMRQAGSSQVRPHRQSLGPPRVNDATVGPGHVTTHAPT